MFQGLAKLVIAIGQFFAWLFAQPTWLAIIIIVGAILLYGINKLIH